MEVSIELLNEVLETNADKIDIDSILITYEVGKRLDKIYVNDFFFKCLEYCAKKQLPCPLQKEQIHPEYIKEILFKELDQYIRMNK